MILERIQALSHRGQVIALLKHSLIVAKGLEDDKQRIVLDTVKQRFYRHRNLALGSRAATEVLQEGWDDIESIASLRNRKKREDNEKIFNSEYRIDINEDSKIDTSKLKLRLRIPKGVDFVYLATIFSPFGTVTRYERECEDTVCVLFSKESEKQDFVKSFPTILPDN